MNACPFCKIVKGNDSQVREICRNKKVVAFFPTDPAVLGHTLVIPAHHAENITDLQQEEASELMLAAQSITKAIYTTLEPDGVNIIQSNGDAASQSICHMHLHVVPRWKNDPIGQIWPEKSHFSNSEKDSVLALLRSSTKLPEARVDSEDRRLHLSFIQDVISRLSESSSKSKGWVLPVATATYGYSIAQSSFLVAMLGIAATFVFGVLDSGYLYTERKYRSLYQKLLEDPYSLTTFSMDYNFNADSPRTIFFERLKTISAWSVAPFYGTLILIGLAISIFLIMGF